VRTADGAAGTISVSAMLPDYRLPEIGMNVVGSEGTMNVNDDRLELDSGVLYRHDVTDAQVPFLLGDPEYTLESDRFTAAVATGVPHGGASFEDGARVEQVIDGILGGTA
jgi:hypothetical protein